MTKNYQGTPIKLDCLKTNDLRTLNFYLRALAARYINIPSPQRGTYYPPKYPTAPLSNPAQIKKEITTALIPFDSYDIKNIDDDFMVFETISLIPLEQFNWLKEDPEACMYVLISSNEFDQYLHWYTKDPYFSYSAPTTHLERYQNIIDYFDHSFLSDSVEDPFFGNNKIPNNKKELLELVKSNWIQVKEITPSLAWLNKNSTEDAIEWTWEYILDYNQNYFHYTTTRSKGIELSNVTTIEDQRLVIITALQNWADHPDTKTLFYQRIRRAWSQRKSRKSRENMIAINSYIDIRSKEKLDRLTKFRGIRMNQMLMKLIDDQYEKQKPDIEDRYGKIGNL